MKTSMISSSNTRLNTFGEKKDLKMTPSFLTRFMDKSSRSSEVSKDRFFEKVIEPISAMDSKKSSSSITFIVKLSFCSLYVTSLPNKSLSKYNFRVFLCNTKHGLLFSIGREGITMKMCRREGIV
jgi:hypothetical protein